MWTADDTCLSLSFAKWREPKCLCGIGAFGTKCARAVAFKQIILEYRRAFLRKAPFENTLRLLTSVMNSVDQYSPTIFPGNGILPMGRHHRRANTSGPYAGTFGKKYRNGVNGP